MRGCEPSPHAPHVVDRPDRSRPTTELDCRVRVVINFLHECLCPGIVHAQTNGAARDLHQQQAAVTARVPVSVTSAVTRGYMGCLSFRVALCPIVYLPEL